MVRPRRTESKQFRARDFGALALPPAPTAWPPVRLLAPH